MEERTGLKIACPEEIALRQRLISINDFERLVDNSPRNGYRQYLEMVLLEYLNGGTVADIRLPS